MTKSAIRAFAVAFSLAAAPLAHAQTVQQALRFVEVERYGDAGRTFRQIIATSPTGDNYFYYGYALALAGKADSAQMMWQQAGAKDAKAPLSHLAQGSAEILKGNLAGAAPHFEEAKKLSKNKSAEVFYRIGEAYTVYDTKDAGLAIQHLTKAAELDKGRPDILVMLGDAYLIPNDGSAAATNYDRAIRLAPNYTKAYIKQGLVYERARSYEAAYKRYTEGMAKDSSYTPGYRYLAELQRKARQRTQAIANYRKYIDRSDRNPDALLRFAGFLIEAGQYEEAARYVAEAEGKTNSPLFPRLKAYTLYETGNAAGAEQALTQFMQTVDTTKTKLIGRDYLYLGRARMATTKDTAQALALIKKGVLRDSNLVDDIKDLGDTAYAQKAYKAATLFRQAYVEAKKNPETNDYFTLGQAAFQAKEYEVADNAFAKVTEVSQGRAPAGEFYRGYVWQAKDPKGSTGNAVKHFNEFLRITADTSKVPAADAPKFSKQRATAYAFLAREEAVKKNYKEAERVNALALKEDPTNKQALQIQQSLDQIKKQPAPKAAPKK